MTREANPLPQIQAGGLPMPEYTNAAIGSAVGRCRKDDGDLYRVTAILENTGKRFGYDLPYSDAQSMARDLEFNPGYEDVTLIKIR